ncbi:MAG: B12-binding domain-containing radical SAM protein [Candidatus Brocadiia bacterium]
MKISLIEPRSPDYHVYSGLAIPRLGLPILGTILEQQGHDVTIYVEDLTEFNPQRAWDVFKSDLVGISITSSTAPRGYAMARLLGLRDIPVIFGGPHANFMPEEGLEFGDYVLRGEAEESFPAFVDALGNNRDLSSIPNLVYRDGEDIVHNERQPLKCELDEIPMPNLELIADHDQMKITPALTTRGCPHNCTFCCVSGMFGRRYRMASIDRVVEEAKSWKGKNVFLCDDNFTAVPSRTKELLDRLLTENRLPKRWYAQVRADTWRDEEMMDLLKRTNCSRVYVGYESVNQKVLDDYNKHQSVNDIKQSIQGFHDYGIPVHGMFMFGAEHDDKGTFERTIGFASHNQIDTVQFLILTPVPGTQLFNRLVEEDRIITRDWSLYDGHHVVFEPARMTPLELQLGTMRANRRFYSVRSSLRSLSTFRFGTAMLRYWGKRVVAAWHQTNSGFIKKLRSWQKGHLQFPQRFSVKKIIKQLPFPAPEPKKLEIPAN